VSAASGVSTGYICRIEHGYTLRPSPRILRQLAGAYSVSYGPLMRKAGHPVELLIELEELAALEPTPIEVAQLVEHLGVLRTCEKWREEDRKALAVHLPCMRG
jgi:transcriptional regulator with XRE-family HTH domain